MRATYITQEPWHEKPSIHRQTRARDPAAPLFTQKSKLLVLSPTALPCETPSALRQVKVEYRLETSPPRD
jgi:hypothetical protein